MLSETRLAAPTLLDFIAIPTNGQNVYYIFSDHLFIIIVTNIHDSIDYFSYSIPIIIIMITNTITIYLMIRRRALMVEPMINHRDGDTRTLCPRCPRGSCWTRGV